MLARPERHQRHEQIKKPTVAVAHSTSSPHFDLRGLLLGPLLSQLAGILGAVTEPSAVEVEDVRCDDKRDGSASEDKAWDRQLPLGAGHDVGVEGSGVEGGNTSEEVAAEAVATSGAGGVFTVGCDLLRS